MRSALWYLETFDRVLGVLRAHDGCCMDNDKERQLVAFAITDALLKK